MRSWLIGPASCVASCVAWAPASAAPPPASGPAAEAPPPRVPYRPAPAPFPGGIVGALPLAPNMQLSIGRFTIAGPARPRTHTEPAHRLADVRRGDRGIAAIGVSLRF
jgi:hypothetical protein